jgi:hypothetical protein
MAKHQFLTSKKNSALGGAETLFVIFEAELEKLLKYLARLMFVRSAGRRDAGCRDFCGDS